MNKINIFLFHLSKFSIDYFYISFDKYKQMPNYTNISSEFIIHSCIGGLPTEFLQSFNTVDTYPKHDYVFLNQYSKDEKATDSKFYIITSNN